MAGSASKRPHSPDKMSKPTDNSTSDGKLFGDNFDDRAIASRSPLEKKKRTTAHHERLKSDLEEAASAISVRNQNEAATALRRNNSLQEGYVFESHSRGSSEKRKPSSPSIRSSSESKPSSINSEMKTSSYITTPEDSGFQAQDDVAELRAWWTNLKSKPTGCGNCGSSIIFENITTGYIREQLDVEYGIAFSVQAAEKIHREKQMKEVGLREDPPTLSRWGKGKKLGEDNDDKEREKPNTPSPKGKGKGKEKAGIENKALGKLLGTTLCPACDKCICLGCLQPLEDPQIAHIEPLESVFGPGPSYCLKSPKGKGSHLRRSGLWCCNEGRVVAIALILACLDEDTLEISLGNDSTSNNSPSRKGFGGAVKRGFRSLKEKIIENPLQRSPGHKSKSKSKTSKGNGTGYGSGGYGHSSGMFGLEFPEPEDWDEADTSDSDDLDNDGTAFPNSYAGIMASTESVGYTSTPPHFVHPHKFPPVFPSVHFSGPGKKLGDGNTASASENDPLQTTGPSSVDYIDLTMDDPPPSNPPVIPGRGGYNVGPLHSSWAGGHPGFLPKGRGIGRGRGGTHHITHFAGPGQTLGGPVASGSGPKVHPLTTPGGFSALDYHPYVLEGPASGSGPKVVHPLTTPGGFPTPDYRPYFLTGWSQNLPQHPGGALPQEVPDNLLLNALVHPGPAKSLDLSVKKPDSAFGSMLPPAYSFSPPGPSPFPHIPSPFSYPSGPGIAKLRPNIRNKAPQGIPSPPPLSPDQTKHDKILTAIMGLLTETLPETSWDPIFDLTPPPPLKMMLRTSMLVEKAEELLRNDSIQDISIHSEMYIAFMGLLRRICACPDLEFLAIERRRKKMHTIGLLKIAQSLPVPDDILRSGPKTRGKVAAAAEEKRRAEVLIYEENSDRKSLMEVSTNLCTQAKFFLKGAEKSEGTEFDGAEATKILGICLEIVGIKDEFEKLASRTSQLNLYPSLEETAHRKNRHLVSPESIRKKPISSQLSFEYHAPIAFEYTENVLNTHHYKAHAHDLKQSPRGRVLHLTRELATMSTSLPQGIFVRIEDSRPDVLKALIVGPGGTPYEGGLYEFDIWAPMEYPVTPPLCIFKTTGGGSVHFNPNLYNCGKVCLSILNTWEGAASEKWQPAISTLLQVFVSIQSMILCDNPWYNEPGRREGTQKKQSEDFNAKVKLNNVRFAMLDWIKDPEKRNGIWKDVIKAHFTENRSHVIDLIKGWAKKDPSIENWRQGMGNYMGGGAFWAEGEYLTTMAGGRRVVGDAVPKIPSSMDMVTEMEGLTKQFFGNENEN